MDLPPPDMETLIRPAFFLGGLFLFALLEVLLPRRSRVEKRSSRWLRNIFLTGFNTFILRLFLPLLPVSLALVTAERGWGILNMVDIHPLAVFVIAIVALDLIIYLQHLMFHAVPLLWRIHAVHHTDLDIDVTTGLRFHPFEIVISLGIKLGAVLLLGPPVLAVVVFEVILNLLAMFNHSNIRLPLPLDRVLRKIIVTPDMHRVHHSVRISETNSNFGFNLSWWDYLLGTYKNQPELGHEAMATGISEYRDPSEVRLVPLLLLPFTLRRDSYSLSRRVPAPDSTKRD
jgi:sterol desaturase/sphingolipid hydroxylase (fatty acid hydroxylase superfamily)